LWGLGRVIALEHPELRCTLADLDANDSASALSSLAAELLAENREDQVRWRSGVRQVARLAASVDGPASGVSVSAEGTYLITGGLGALGLEVARWLVSQGVRHLVLLGRKSPSSQARAAVDALERTGAGVTIMQADVAQAADLQLVFDSLRLTHPPLRGVVHAAGVLGDGVLVQQTSARFAEVMAPKIAGAWNLHTLTRDLPLDFLVFFSSMASVLGSPGQGNYAAANAFLDALAHYRRTRGLPALSINWGPWAAVGMAASQDERRQRRREAQGIRAISPEEGAQVLQALIGRAAAQIGVLPVEWSQLLRQFDGDPPPLFADIAQNVVPLRPPKPDVRRRLASVPESKREEFLSAHVRQQAGEVLGLEPKYPLDPNKPLKELGLDSLMAVELAKMLGAGIELPLPATLVFTYPTVRTIAAYLLAELFPQQAAQESHQEEKHRQLVAEVQQLSDSELEAFVYGDSVRVEDRR
jgi:NAD(P)-dependent dehydrogenase (short-subunit alcohol dehydrogenase family)/acyl carrier protein